MSTLAAAETTRLEDFGSEPIWLVVVKTVAIFVFLVVMTLFSIVFERKVVGRMQNRLGPNRVGPWGVLQSLADGLKLAFKEDIMPVLADKPVYFLAPVLSAIPAFLAFSVIPFGPTVSIFGHHTPLQLTDLPVGVLIVFACSSLGVYGVVLSGWASGSTYPLLGGMRSAAQMISYEIAMGLSLVGVFMYSESMSTSEIVASQQKTWNVVPLTISFVIYAIAVVGETNRSPFDLPEAESELVGGFHTEYSSLKFALFFLAEYINMVTVSALAATLFFGGWRAPWPVSAVWEGANSGWWPLLWFLGKVVFGIFVFVWLRGTLPRLRYDQFMRFGWKWLIPANLAWIMVSATIKVLRDQGWGLGEIVPKVVVPTVVVVLAAWALVPLLRRRPEPEPDLPPAFPVPPMDLVVPPSPRLAAVAARPAAGVGAGTESGAESGADEPAAVPLGEGEPGVPGIAGMAGLADGTDVTEGTPDV